MTQKDSLKRWIVNKMNSNKWYPVKKHNVEVLKELFYFHPNIELTFNKDYTQIKKTVWKNGKPN